MFLVWGTRTQEEGEPQAENQSVPVAVDDIGCEGECDVEIREVGTEADIVGVLSDGLQCEAEGEGEIRDDGVQCEVEGDVEMREDVVHCEVEGDGELRDVEVNCEPETEGEMREDEVQCEVEAEGDLRDIEVNCEGEAGGQVRDVEVTKEVEEDMGQIEIEEDGDVHSWTESGPDDSMNESTDNLLDVSVDCDIDDELRHKEWPGNVEVEVESGSRGQSIASGPQVNQSYDTNPPPPQPSQQPPPPQPSQQPTPTQPSHQPPQPTHQPPPPQPSHQPSRGALNARVKLNARRGRMP
ncbi:hypothetical protein DEO72_LG9g1576 [Vigna unguiculata]|uniref:Uncharacterized protein n=1 Tax=Vigna unguiculata TaxID=3917 RepID=A0A4D6N0T0_VIGUN|nr:hypothetical protein DEO72_LG9g1576 [Vigna unguiculata]